MSIVLSSRLAMYHWMVRSTSTCMGTRQWHGYNMISKNTTKQYKDIAKIQLITTRTLLNAEELRLWLEKIYDLLQGLYLVCTILTQCPICSCTTKVTHNIIGYHRVFIMQYVNRNDASLHWVIFKFLACTNNEYLILGFNLLLLFCKWGTCASF